MDMFGEWEVDAIEDQEDGTHIHILLQHDRARGLVKTLTLILPVRMAEGQRIRVSCLGYADSQLLN